MKLKRTHLSEAQRANTLKDWIDRQQGRLGLITSLDGTQLITLVLDPTHDTALCWETPIEENSYHSLTPLIPQCHWFERTVWDLFGLYPEGHPRLKHNLLHEPYDTNFQPLRNTPLQEHAPASRNYVFLEVKGEGIYEIPVGPIHAGIIEPGHFRFSCLGEIIVNLEIRLGYLHRGVEKRLTEIPWQKTRFVAEAAASDTAAANALAHAIAMESLCEVQVPARAEHLRTITLEIERIAMHLADLGGIAGDIGFLAISSSMARLRGDALRLGELLTGTRLLRAFICPGGVVWDPAQNLTQLRQATRQLKGNLAPVLDMLLDNQGVRARMEKIGSLSPSLARDFGLVGVAARASNVPYDAREHFCHGVYPRYRPATAIEQYGDVHCRTKVRVTELKNSLEVVTDLLNSIPTGPVLSRLPKALPSNSVGL